MTLSEALLLTLVVVLALVALFVLLSIPDILRCGIGRWVRVFLFYGQPEHPAEFDWWVSSIEGTPVDFESKPSDQERLIEMAFRIAWRDAEKTLPPCRTCGGVGKIKCRGRLAFCWWCGELKVVNAASPLAA